MWLRRAGRERRETGWKVAWERLADMKAWLALLVLFGFSWCWSYRPSYQPCCGCVVSAVQQKLSAVVGDVSVLGDCR